MLPRACLALVLISICTSIRYLSDFLLFRNPERISVRTQLSWRCLNTIKDQLGDIMQIRINGGSGIDVGSELSRRVESAVSRAFNRFEDQITCVEVHLSDVNSDKSGPLDKRCLMEARVAGLDSIAVANLGSSVEEAAKGACEKLQTTLENRFGRARSKS